MGIIDVQNLAFSYGKKEVLKKIDHSFKEGTFTAILGVNGSGKSTMIKIVNGLLTPKQGNIKLHDKDLMDYRLAELSKKIAYVPQGQNNYFPTTVFDTVLTGRMPHMTWAPNDDDNVIVEEVLKSLNLLHLALRDISQLSGGQRQKVFIARALAQKTNIIILDEPTSNLDMKHQKEVMHLLNKLTHEGYTIIMALHDLNVAIQYCTDYLFLKSGYVRAAGDESIITEELISDVYDLDVQLINVNDRLVMIPD